MSTGTVFKADIAAHLNRSDLSTMIATCCDLAVKRLERELFWFQLTSTTVSTTASTGYASFPSDFLKDVQGGFTDTNATPLLKESLATIINWQTSLGSSDEPAWFAIADKFYFYPIPDDTYALPLRYYKSLGFPGDSADNAWTTDAEDLTFWAVLEELWRYLRNMEEQAKALSQKNLLIAELRHLSGKLTGTGRVRYIDY